jgi:DNA mismatch repair ATPase MutS
MTISEMIHEIPHMRYRLESAKHKETLDEIEEVLRHHKEINEVLDQIRTEIIDKYMTAAGEVNTVAKGCLQIIDKYRAESNDEWDRVTMIDVDGNTHKVTFKKEIEDIGDYPDEIPNQFDNLTGSMNV